ncbi:Eco57I restriction-modification methylase domain-containing protein [Giesbergeria anulus]|uniref:site-specific DNA-methyltransferase (adenine-specific) n=1 Tax=Giesbergeria anulus TaxID=180197 RepID=A0A1H9QSK8_9BURK|nr:N-6 DNA methylase [Giesbergeria anulus]SER62819.1 Methyltransferase domain-containing protein [Giesbergeria anulus]
MPTPTTTLELFAAPWLNNSLLDTSFLQQKSRELAAQPLPSGWLAWLQQQFQPSQLAASNEAQLEDCFISPLLKQLGWVSVPQQVLVVQGKTAKPDWCLLLQPEQAQALMAQQSEGHRLIAAICESKAWDKPLDTGKARQDNPHHQLQDYLSTLRVRFGFLTNGRCWRVYDTDKITAKKSFIEFDLEKILALPAGDEQQQALALFTFFFSRDTYAPAATAPTGNAMEQAIADSSAFTVAVEENLKAVIYGYDGEDSLFELIGKAIYQANAQPQPPTLEAVYENSIVLLFRLLFVVYFEDKNRDLLALHPFYNEHSLQALHQKLRRDMAQRPQQHNGMLALRQLFRMLDEGEGDIDVPLFNGGLFDPQRAPLLKAAKIFDNRTLLSILDKLLFKSHRGNTLFDTRRDFKNMNVTHLGRIYEGLLEFRFECAPETATYLEYQSSSTAGKSVEAYFDAYDVAQLRKEKGFKVLRELSVQAGAVYLKSASNSRKTSASYYTPASLSDRLVQASIERALEAGKPLAQLKILDNACGSGHFLVQALACLADMAVQRLEHDAPLAQLLHEERAKITQQFAALNLPYTPDDGQILKRLLLKRCIYGVDLNPFAVELARLSLWMDSFIFGTPLSFIEHHIQHGNALVGATVQDCENYNATTGAQDDLFVQGIAARFDALRSVMHELDAMRDTTAAEVAQSKALWRNSITPQLRPLFRALSFMTTRRMLLAEGKAPECEALDKTPDLLAQLFDENGSAPTQVLRQIEDYARRYHFFHYEVAFPEAFGGSASGFDVVLGNPPWDKTKFSDTDFFPQYHSRYRSAKNTEKAAIQQRLLGSAHIQAAYDEAQSKTGALDAYYKEKDLFPLNKGAIDGNLFRLFVERNLRLLAPGGSLNYVLPSALMFEEGSLALRRHILTHCQMPFFYSFENNKGIFPDVHRSYKFALMQVLNVPPPKGKKAAAKVATIDTAFYVLDAAELDDPARHVPYPLATLKTLSPQQWALMELRDAADLPILGKCHAAFAPLSADWLDFRRELHMTHDKDLFLERATPSALPLYEGKMIWQYKHLFDTAQYWLEPAAFDARLHSKELYRMAQDLGVPKAQVTKYASAVRFDREFVRLAFRVIASDTNERTLVFALLPQDCGTGHSMFATVPKHYALPPPASANGNKQEQRVTVQPVSYLRLLFALAWFNSLPMDWLARLMVQINVSQTYLYRLPMPQPSDEEILQNPDYTALAKNALLLTLAASWDDFASTLAPQMKALGIAKKDLPATAKAQDKLRADIDQRVARLYGLGHDELLHVLHSFKVMAAKRPEYLTLFGISA